MLLKSIIFSGYILLACLLTTKTALCGNVLVPPRVTDWGSWGKWDDCPTGTFATGMQLYSHAAQGILTDDRGLTGIKLFCNTLGMKSENVPVKSDTDKVGNWGKKYFCPSIMTGFQMRHEPYQTVFMDDAAASNVRMFCDGNPSVHTEGDGNAFGKWTEKRLCSSYEAICGISTQVDKSNSWDLTGINGVMMKCCNITHPLQNCAPKTTWELVGSCNFPLGKAVKPCKYLRKQGISFKDGKNSPIVMVYERAGFGLHKLNSQLSSKFIKAESNRNVNRAISGFEELLEYYWSTAQDKVWQPEFSSIENITTNAGQNVMVYQIRGACGLLQVWGTKLKKVVHTKTNEHETKSTTYFDFNDNAFGNYFNE